MIDLKKSSGKEHEQIKIRIIKKFNLATNEKWVATKLRLMLINLGSCKELLAIGCNGKNTPRREGSSQQRKSSGYKANIIAAEDSTKPRKPRQTLEEKQLAKLRNLNIEDVMADEIENSKFMFLESFGLVPVTIAL